MATLKLSRQQLSSFLKDLEQIKQFERLFSIVEQVSESPDTKGAELEIGINSAAISSLLSEISEIKKNTEPCLADLENSVSQVVAQLEKIKNDLQALETLPVIVPKKRSRYGHFYDTTTQTAAAINTATAITFNTSDISNGVFLDGTKIYVDTDGIYSFQFTIQIDKTSGGTGLFWIWPRLNGVDVPNSALQIQIQGNNAEIFSGANFFFNLKALDYVELMFSVNDTTVQLQSFAASAPVPAVPSIIVSVSNNIKGDL